MNPYAFFSITTYYNSSKQSTNTNTLLSNSNDFLQSITSTFSIIFIIGSILFILAIAFLIRWWMVQTAVFEMRDDILSIRNQIVRDEVDQDEMQNYKEIIETDNLPEDKMDDTNKAHVIGTIVQNTSMIIEKAKVAKFPKWLLIVAIAIIVILISLNVCFLFLK